MSNYGPDMPGRRFGEPSGKGAELPRTLEEAHAELLRLREEATGLRRENEDKDQLIQDMSRLALTDPVTELGNRHAFDIDFPRVIGRAARISDPPPVALLAADADGLKRVNDTLGHPVGDLLLRAIADTIRTVARPSDRGYRVGGDEFVVVKSGFDPKGDVRTAINRTVARYERTVQEKISRVGIPPELDAGASFVLDLPLQGETHVSFATRVDEQLNALKNQRRQERRERLGSSEPDDRL